MTRDGSIAVAADPERDQVWVVDLSTKQWVATLPLTPGDEPGRLVEDGAGRVHVALRRGGAVVTLERTPSWRLGERRAVCAAPRGIEWDAVGDLLHVACQEGTLVTLATEGLEGMRRIAVAPDLRDVVVQDGRLWVSRFKTAAVLVLGPDGQVQSELRSPTQAWKDETGNDVIIVPAVAWRMVGTPGGLLLLHQVVRASQVNDVGCGSYGVFSSGGAIIQPGLTEFDASDADHPPSRTNPASGSGVLVVDLAVSPSGRTRAFAGAGNSIVILDERDAPEPRPFLMLDQPVAVAFAGESTLAVLTRAPELRVYELGEEGTSAFSVPLPGASREHTGHTLFHREAGRGVACASCHPEGGEDGRTWNFLSVGPRRTQPLWGGLLETAPFHWNGAFDTMRALVGEVYVRRMAGAALENAEVDALARWIDSIPVPPRPPVQDPAAVERGRALFDSESVGCASCHAGPKGTSGTAHDVGTGGLLQVPHLMGLAYRAPFLHDGCAPTLPERFGACGGGDTHGHTSHLSSEQLGDLQAYLETR